MSSKINLRELTDLTTPDRCFLTLYLKTIDSLDKIESKIDQISNVLSGSDSGMDERTHLRENFELVLRNLKQNPIKQGSACIFACWMMDFFKIIYLPVEVNDLIRVDSSPYVRPLAEFQDEYENVAVVVADNKSARIYIVSSAVAGDAETIHGNVKNHVRKGGWSQQRYERRRDKQLLLYSREITDRLQSIDQEEQISHIVMVGGKEILREIYKNLPAILKDKSVIQSSDLSKGAETVNEDLREIFAQLERKSEQYLWEKIRHEYLQEGLGVVGIPEVLKAIRQGKVDTMIVHRHFKADGQRCRDCQNLLIDQANHCPFCGSESLYQVDLVEELVELVNRQGGQTDFSDPIDTLESAGSIGALLRYH